MKPKLAAVHNALVSFHSLAGWALKSFTLLLCAHENEAKLNRIQSNASWQCLRKWNANVVGWDAVGTHARVHICYIRVLAFVRSLAEIKHCNLQSSSNSAVAAIRRLKNLCRRISRIYRSVLNSVGTFGQRYPFVRVEPHSSREINYHRSSFISSRAFPMSWQVWTERKKKY